MFPPGLQQVIPEGPGEQLQNSSLIMSLQTKVVMFTRKTVTGAGNRGRVITGSQLIKQVPVPQPVQVPQPVLRPAQVLPQQDPQHNPLQAETISTGRLQAGIAVQQGQTITRLLQGHQPAVTEEECPEQVVVDFQVVEEEEEDSRKSISCNLLPANHLSGHYRLSSR